MRPGAFFPSPPLPFFTSLSNILYDFYWGTKKGSFWKRLQPDGGGSSMNFWAHLKCKTFLKKLSFLRCENHAFSLTTRVLLCCLRARRQILIKGCKTRTSSGGGNKSATLTQKTTRSNRAFEPKLQMINLGKRKGI